MKLIATIVFLGLFSTSSFAQVSDPVSDLRIKVDSIIRYQIKYEVDSSTNLKPAHERDSIAHTGLRPAPASVPLNPLTKIILNGQPIRLGNLDQYKLEDIAEIKVFPKNDATAMALYGSSARNGIIIIRLKK